MIRDWEDDWVEFTAREEFNAYEPWFLRANTDDALLDLRSILSRQVGIDFFVKKAEIYLGRYKGKDMGDMLNYSLTKKYQQDETRLFKRVWKRMLELKKASQNGK